MWGLERTEKEGLRNGDHGRVADSTGEFCHGGQGGVPVRLPEQEEPTLPPQAAPSLRRVRIYLLNSL